MPLNFLQKDRIMDYTQTSFKRIMGPTGGASTSTSEGGMKILEYGGGGGSNPYGQLALKRRQEREDKIEALREMEARIPDEVKKMAAYEKERQRAFFTGPQAQMAASQGRLLTREDYENRRVYDAGLSPGKSLSEMRPEERNMWLEKAGRFK